LLVDVSSSMDMNVAGPDAKSATRMAVAKEMVARFIAGDGDTLKGRPNDLIGLITFARYADTRSPLTTGHDALLQIVRQLEVQDRPNEDGTAYGDALAIAAARLKDPDLLDRGDADIKSRVIVLLTDGENNSGAHLPLEAAGLAKSWGCRIYSISMSDPQSENQLNAADRVLEHLSEETGGIFRQANDFESLRAVYAEIDRLERSEITTRGYERVAEWFWVPLASATAVLLLALFLEATWLRVAP
jgi:Ca-activated chloride channel family protein